MNETAPSSSPRVRAVRVRRFKSLVDVRLELAALNIFVGPNGAGKSNVLEAFGMLSTVADGEISYAGLEKRGVRLSSAELFRSAFRKPDRAAQFFFDVDFDQNRYSVGVSSSTQGKARWTYQTESLKREGIRIASRSPRGATISGRSDFDARSVPTDKSIVVAGELLGVLSQIERERLSALRRFAIYAPSTPVLRGVINDATATAPLGLYGGGMAQALMEILTAHPKEADVVRRLFRALNWLTKVETAFPTDLVAPEGAHLGKRALRFTDAFMKRGIRDLSAYDVSEGVLYFLFALLLLAHPTSPPFFAIDNVDSGLNPAMTRQLVGLIRELLERHHDRQVLLTTHQPALLDAIDLFDPEVRLFVVQRNQLGHTTVERISPPAGYSREQWNMLHGEMRLSELWLDGTIPGAVPPKAL